MHIRCPHCQNPIELVDDGALHEGICPSCGSSFSLIGSDETATHRPETIKSLAHFTLQEQLGFGAFGTVWKAKDTELDRTVAIKVPRKGQLDEVESESFFREARAVAQLKHPNIVSVHEVGRDGDTVYIVSDLVVGLTLTDWLTGQSPSPREAAVLCVKISEGLHHAHERGVIHRDLKPGNIMLDRQSEPHIMDFGLAKREAGEITMTLDGQIIGTPAYMSPEQARGESHTVDRRADIYSLGTILFELLTGERPFSGNKQMLLHQLLTADVPSPRKFKATLPRDLETICLKCLRREPDRRYSTCKEVAEDLNRWLTDKPILARRTSVRERFWKWCSRNQLLAGSLAITCLSLLCAAVVFGMLLTKPRPEQLSINQNTPEAVSLPEGARRFTSDEASEYQEFWAHRLDVPATEENAIGMQLALIPPGEFLMGSTDSEVALVQQESDESLDNNQNWLIENIDGEKPQRSVQFHESFHIGVHEVTVGQFRKFVEATGYLTDAEKGEGGTAFDGEEWRDDETWNWNSLPYEQSDDEPVLELTWNDAVRFCEWLGEIENAAYTLPTESEWEYACRAGSLSRYFFGSDESELNRYAWYGEQKYGAPRPVGQKLPNPFGLYDIYGNVWERCVNESQETGPGEIPSPDYQGPDVGSKSVIRGGSYWDLPWLLRSAARIPWSPGSKSTHIGFRVVKRFKVIAGNAVPPSPKGSFALRFDGSTSRVPIPTLKYDGSYPLTIEAVCYPNATNTSLSMHIVADIESAGTVLALRVANDRCRLITGQHRGGEYRYVKGEYFPMRRVHLAGVFDGGHRRVYVDGECVAREPEIEGYLASPLSFAIGCNPSQGDSVDAPLGVVENAFAGSIEELRFSKVARYTDDFEPQSHFKTDTDTIALYHFDEGTGTVLHDVSDNGHHGTIISAEWVNANGTKIEQ